MLDSFARKYYDKYFLEKVIQRFTKLPPMGITLFGCSVGVFAAFLIAFGFAKLAVCMILFSGFLDSVDGAVARKQNKDSPVGCVADIFSDRIVEVAIILGLFAYDPTRALLCLLMMGSILLCITAFLIVSSFLKNESMKSFAYSIGMVERTEAFLFFIAMCLFPSFFTPLAICFSALVTLTALIHIFRFIAFSKQ